MPLILKNSYSVRANTLDETVMLPFVFFIVTITHNKIVKTGVSFVWVPNKELRLSLSKKEQLPRKFSTRQEPNKNVKLQK